MISTEVEVRTVVDLVAEASGPVEARLEQVFETHLARWQDGDPARRYPLLLLRDFTLCGGKRLRPALCYWGYRAVSAAPAACIFDLGAALELLHSFAMIHDDIVDRAPLRRGRPTVHKRAESYHRNAGWRGDAEHYGRSIALLVGDLGLTLADELIRDSPPELRQAFDSMRVELCLAECYEVTTAARGIYDGAVSTWIAQHKSGNYTGGWPPYLGALLGGGSPARCDALRAFGDLVGEAFQLRDDLLGVFGSPLDSGKSVTSDLAAGSPTPLLAVAHEAADETQRQRLSLLLNRSTELDVAAVRQLLIDTGAPERVEERIAELMSEAEDLLAQIGLDRDMEQALRVLARFAVGRRGQAPPR